MTQPSFQSESRAFAALQKLLEDAAATQALFEAAGLPLPSTLARIVNVPQPSSNGPPRAVRATIAPPEPPNRPPEAKDDWISVNAKDLFETTLVLAILRAAKAPMSSRDVMESVAKYNPNVVYGTVMNIGARLADRGIIARSEDGWSLQDPGQAPILSGSLPDTYAWGPMSVFQKQDLAQYRRMLILHILRAYPRGLMTVQIVDQLASAEFCRLPCTKDIIKADMEALSGEGKVKRVGNTRKFKLPKEK